MTDERTPTSDADAVFIAAPLPRCPYSLALTSESMHYPVPLSLFLQRGREFMTFLRPNAGIDADSIV
jgi:hypothetical protein